MNPVVHFEMPAQDKVRAKKFYESAFGWEMQQMGQDMGNYMIAITSPVDEHQMHKNKGAINGGFWETDKKEFPHVVISVDDLKESIEKVKKAGGKVLGGGNPNKKSPEEPDDIKGIGLFVMIEDSEGNHVGMLQPAPRQ